MVSCLNESREQRYQILVQWFPIYNESKEQRYHILVQWFPIYNESRQQSTRFWFNGFLSMSLENKGTRFWFTQQHGT
jgi:hypothetical protein